GSSTTKDGKANLSVFIIANDHESEIYNNMFKEYQEAHADTINDIDVQITTQDEYSTTLTGMMTANDLPDIFYVGPESVKDFVDNGYIENLQPILDKAGIKTDGLSAQEALNSYRYDGTQTGSGDIYALPKDASVFAYAYNKDIFDEAGIDYPDPENPYTYDEFVEVCTQLTKDTDGDGEIDQWGCGTADQFMMYQYIWSNGASFLSDDHKTVTIDTPEFKEAVQKYVDLTLVHEVTPTVEQDTSLGVYQRWLAGQEAFYACGTWDVAAFEDKETFPFNWDLCGYPTLSTGVSQTWLGTVGFCVSSKSENKDIAADLVSYLSTNEDGQRELSGISTGESIQLPNITTLAEGEFVDSIASGDLAFPSNVDVFFNYLGGTDKYSGKFMETTYTPNAEWMNLFFEGFANVKNGSMTVEDYIAQVQPEMQSALDKAWADAE
ncbi:MAG: sugar ABC transporter substrate-binding protein, partial [Clostridia bacterium]|nr:sugar ABC transporter substrate-binding protein [Clostridia bacterium]